MVLVMSPLPKGSGDIAFGADLKGRRPSPKIASCLHSLLNQLDSDQTGTDIIGTGERSD